MMSTYESLEERLPFEISMLARRGRLTAEGLCRDRRGFLEFEDLLLARVVVGLVAMRGIYDTPALVGFCTDHPDRWQELQLTAVRLCAEQINAFVTGIQMAQRGGRDLAVVTYSNLAYNHGGAELLDAVLSGWTGGMIEGVSAAGT